ncbi:glucan endo-1,3-beta-D-glucosidase 1 [[Candida] anglica]|uniref:glucan endo-1,3-beta-D-glucosidase n=1 Tax=[Candida] anglica TaxID=148631 RepID=A0ABP0EN05_9ASCO
MLSKFIPLFLAGKALADITTTYTHTNYITPDCFKSQLSTIFPEQNGYQNTNGFEVVIVYGDQEVDKPSPVTSTSELIYTVNTHSTTTKTVTSCSNGACTTGIVSQVIPHTYALTTKVTYTTTGETTTASTTPTTSSSSSSSSSSSTSSKKQKTLYETDNVTTNIKVHATVTKSAETTTKVLYSASTVPTTIYKPSTTSETITQTQKNPLVTQSVVSKSKSQTISISDITKGVTISTKSSSDSSVTRATSSSIPHRYANTTSAITGFHNQTAAGAQPTPLFKNSTTSNAITGFQNQTAAGAQPTPLFKNSTLSTIDLRVSQTKTLANSTVRFYNTSLTQSLPTALAGVNVTSISNGSVIILTSSILPTEATEVTKLATTSTSAKDTVETTSTSSSLSLSSSSSTSTSTGLSSPTGSQSFSGSDSNGYTGDLFDVISTSNPPSVFPRANLPLGIPSGVDNNDVPYQTNKFYANLFLDDQTDMIWSNPYGYFWKKKDYYGFAVQHTDPNARVFGTPDTNNPNVYSYFLNPTNQAELIISATSLTSDDNYMSVSDMKEMSVSVKLSPSSSVGNDYIEIPIVQGMGFITSIYHGNLTPLINSLVGVKDLSQETSSALPSNILKFRATLFSGTEWLIYVTLPSAGTTSRRSLNEFTFDVTSPYAITGSQSIDGLIIQMATAPTDKSQDGFYDEAAGLYVTDANVKGSVSSGTSASYSFDYSTSGKSSSGRTLLFAFPHHIDALTDSTTKYSTGIVLSSTTKGDMQAYLTNQLTFAETLATDIQFLPWSQTSKSPLSYTAEELQLLATVANEELSVDIPSTVANMDSNYFSGKVLDKYAYILLVVNDIIQDEEVAKSTLAELKTAFETFTKNKQYYGLMYDTRYGGVTSTASQNGDTGADYGSGYYNDHHFHYGYFVHAAAVVGYVDKKFGGTWAEDNKDWVNSLIRDVANPSQDDKYFPVSRMFDWFSGHSWAAGLFSSGDGKNEESSSEDYNFSYGMKLWGNVIGDQSMESRGDLMLAITRRAMNMYFLYTSDNTVEPAGFIGNKVSGILFENKIAYTTFFGTPADNPEYVHGIHMLPITPVSSFIRGPKYAAEEWKDQVSTFIDKVDSGWTGILRLNQALFDANTSYDFFSSSNWNSEHLDNGQSRTWCLAYSGGIANTN